MNFRDRTIETCSATLGYTELSENMANSLKHPAQITSTPSVDVW